MFEAKLGVILSSIVVQSSVDCRLCDGTFRSDLQRRQTREGEWRERKRGGGERRKGVYRCMTEGGRNVKIELRKCTIESTSLICFDT